MKIVLLERIERLGRMGDIVTVANGFARNFLLPKKKALRATTENIEYFQKERAKLEAVSQDLQTRAEGVAKKIADLKIILIRQSSESGILYGSVTTRDVAKEMALHGTVIQHSQVRIHHPIKTIGVHRILIQLHPEVGQEIIVSIAPSIEEAQAQLVKPIDKAEDAFKEKKKTSRREIETEETTAGEEFTDNVVVDTEAEEDSEQASAKTKKTTKRKAE